jgi:hypothetical protein
MSAGATYGEPLAKTLDSYRGRLAGVTAGTASRTDFNLLAAAVNLARLATLGLTHTPHHGWALTAS